MGSEMKEKNIVMFPFMAQGHIIPFLALAHHIARLSPQPTTITFVNTPLNISKLRSSLPPNSPSSSSPIRLLEIPFSGADHGLPPGTENTDGLPYPLIYRLIRASVSLQPAFRNLISHLLSLPHQNRLCIISDMFFPWSADIAREFGLFHAIFCGGGGFGFACYYSLWLNLPHKNMITITPDRREESSTCGEKGYFPLPDFPEAAAIHLSQLAPALLAADETDPWTKFQATILPKWADADAILFNTVEGIDGAGLGYFRRKMKTRPIWPIGPVLLPLQDAGKQSGVTPEEVCLCREWLDQNPPNSVLYICFGSQNSPSPSQMMQLALALEASGRNFIWVVRPPSGLDPNSEFNPGEWLPEGFQARLITHTHERGGGGRGFLVHRWAPQVEILNHKSISAFLSHGGWNSVLEALSRGVPIIGWPMAAEQFYNVKYLEEKLQVCVEVARGSNSEVSKDDILEKIELVMGEESKIGKEMRSRAREAMGMIMDAIRDEEGGYKGSSVKAMDDFFEAAFQLKG